MATHFYSHALKRILTDEEAAQQFGLGDAVAAVATPIARALRLPCIDPATKQLRPESGCTKRKARLNALTQMQPPTEPPVV